MPKTTHTADPGEAYTDFLIPGAPDDRPVFLGVNGECIRVKPGEHVTVKRKFVEVWDAARAQEREARETCRRAQEASKKALANL